MDQRCVVNGVLIKAHESASAFEYIVKEILFSKFHAARPEISQDVFLAVLGRLMGQTPFTNVMSYGLL